MKEAVALAIKRSGRSWEFLYNIGYVCHIKMALKITIRILWIYYNDEWVLNWEYGEIEEN